MAELCKNRQYVMQPHHPLLLPVEVGQWSNSFTAGAALKI